MKNYNFNQIMACVEHLNNIGGENAKLFESINYLQEQMKKYPQGYVEEDYMQIMEFLRKLVVAYPADAVIRYYYQFLKNRTPCNLKLKGDNYEEIFSAYNFLMKNISPLKFIFALNKALYFLKTGKKPTRRKNMTRQELAQMSEDERIEYEAQKILERRAKAKKRRQEKLAKMSEEEIAQMKREKKLKRMEKLKAMTPEELAELKKHKAQLRKARKERLEKQKQQQPTYSNDEPSDEELDAIENEADADANPEDDLFEEEEE